MRVALHITYRRPSTLGTRRIDANTPDADLDISQMKREAAPASIPVSQCTRPLGHEGEHRAVSGGLGDGSAKAVGLAWIDDDDTKTNVTPACMFCQETRAVELTRAEHRLFTEGMLIQGAMPSRPAPERELIRTGIHPACRVEAFGTLAWQQGEKSRIYDAEFMTGYDLQRAENECQVADLNHKADRLYRAAFDRSKRGGRRD